MNCCTIDWFSEWPADALRSVALKFLQDIPELDTTDEVMDGLVSLLEPCCKKTCFLYICKNKDVDLYMEISSFLNQNFKSLPSLSSHFLYPPQTVFVGGYTVFTLSVRPSVRPSVRNVLIP